MARRHVALVVRTEVRRRLRSLDDPKKGLAYALSGLVGVGVGIAAVVGAYVLGGAVAAGALDAPLPAAASVAVGVLALPAFVTGVRAVQETGVPAAPETLLLAARHRDVVTATLVVEALLPLAMVGVPGVLASLTFAAGAGSPASAPPVATAVLLLVLVGSAAGFALGLVVRNAVARSRALARYKGGVGFLLMLAYFAVLYGTDASDAFAPAVRLLAATPLAWFGDLALLAVVPAASPLRAAGAVGLAGLALLACWAASDRLATWLWYSVPVQPHGGEAESSIGGLPWLGRTTDRIVRKTWTRARRAPMRLVYVVYPLMFSIGPLVAGFDGTVPGYVAPSLVVYGAWTTGAAFTLNPIGDETPVLPVTLTTPVRGRRFVRALWLASAAPGVPLTAVLAIAAGVLAGYPPTALALVAVLGVCLPALAPGLAAGVGAAFPRTEPARVTRSRRVVVPSLVAFGGYSFALLLLASPAWLALGGDVRRAVGGLVGVSPLVVGLAGTAVALALVGAGALLGSRHAARTFDGYTLG